MKALIFVEMVVLWFGNVNHYMKEDKTDLNTTVQEVGLRTAVPVSLLAFFLFLLADLGAAKIAALFGALVSFAYLMGSADTLNDVTDAILKEAAPETTTEPPAPAEGVEPLPALA